MERLTVRLARVSDAREILDIYEPYVADTAITFEWEVPDVFEMSDRIKHTLERYPYLVAEGDGRVLGYAYAGPFKGRAAYDWAVETSIYVERTLRGAGVGGALYRELEALLAHMGVINLNACIAYAEREDEFLTNDSVAFHAHVGYALVGRFHKCGYKFGRWYDMVWMEKMLRAHPVEPKPLLAMDEVAAWYEAGHAGMHA